MKTETISGKHALDVCRISLDVNGGDRAANELITAIFCELFDCSSDQLAENLKKG